MTANKGEHMHIKDFLLARIAEDERIAKDAEAVRDDGTDRGWVDGPAAASGKWWVYWTGEKFGHKATADHIAHHDPARVLAECAAKRELVDTWYDEHGGGHVLKTLAAIYSDHPDYQQAWLPNAG